MTLKEWWAIKKQRERVEMIAREQAALNRRQAPSYAKPRQSAPAHSHADDVFRRQDDTPSFQMPSFDPAPSSIDPAPSSIDPGGGSSGGGGASGDY